MYNFVLAMQQAQHAVACQVSLLFRVSERYLSNSTRRQGGDYRRVASSVCRDAAVLLLSSRSPFALAS